MGLVYCKQGRFKISRIFLGRHKQWCEGQMQKNWERRALRTLVPVGRQDVGERGSGLKTVWKVKVARLGCCSLTGGKHDAALRGKKKNHSCFPSCKYSVLFFLCFWYGVVCSKLVRVSSRIASPQIHHLTTLTAGGLEGENWKPAGHRLKLREPVWTASWLWGTEDGLNRST